MDRSTESQGNDVTGFLKKFTTKIRGDPDEKKKLSYRETLRRRRTRVVCIKLFANALFLFAWLFVSLNDNTYSWDTLLGRNVWLDFWVYFGVSVGLPFFSFLGLLRDKILVSQVWFEVAWLFAVSGFDGYLVSRQTRFWPPFKEMAQSTYDDPYLTISVVLYVLTVVGLVIDLALSLLWAGFLCTAAAINHRNHGGIWLSHAQKFQWLSRKAPDNLRFELPRQRIVGTPIEPPPRQSIPTGLKDWLIDSTMFRRFGDLEPLSYCLLRGGVALLFWIILLAYAILNCVINPIRQFTLPKGLPTNSLTQDSRVTDTFGHISGFIVLNSVPATDFLSSNSQTCDSIRSGIQANFTNPATGHCEVTLLDCLLATAHIEEFELAAACQVNCGTVDYWDPYQEYLQLEAWWDCGSIWDTLGFRTSEAAPDDRPYVSVVWNASAYPARPVLNAGFFSVPTSRGVYDFNSVVTWGVSPRDWKRGVTFNFTTGQTARIEVGRRRFYANRATFLDLIGIAQSPDVFVTYPILSLVRDAASPSPQLTTLNFYPGFGAYNDEIYEEYLEHTVLSGLSTTGGLYTSFDVLFILIFGRSLLAALFGSKHITPFGALASIVQKESFRKRLRKDYPGIDGEDRAQRSHATCDYLRDFVLDLNPLDIEPTYKPKRKDSKDKDQTNVKSEVNGEKDDIERGQNAVPNLTYSNGSAQRA